MLSRSLVGLLIIGAGLTVAAGIITLGSGSLTPYLRTQVATESETPSPTPTDTPSLADCGNGIIEPPEECDADHLNGQPGMGCTAECKFEPPAVTEGCGNGIIEPDEECDDGDDNGLSCSTLCYNIDPPEGCGDGIVQLNEECDDGADNGLFCRTDCQNPEPLCGNSVINHGEECDVGPLNGGRLHDGTLVGCSADCQFVQQCGNNRVEPPEQCDEGTLNGQARSRCSTDCEHVFSTCGNNIVEAPFEECDDGNTTNADGCSAECTEELACLCQYQDIPECASYNTPLTCTQAQTPPNNFHECRWSGDDIFDGSCVPRFKEDCQEWLDDPAQKDDCTVSLITKRSVDITNIPVFMQYPKKRYHHEGHGQSCFALERRAIVCLQGTTNLDFLDSGCSTFDNAEQALASIGRIQANLQPGQRVTVTGNQTTASNICTTHVTYHVTVHSSEVTYDQCHNEDTICYEANEDAICTPGTGEPRSEVCCDRGDGVLRWRAGNTCEETTEGMCRSQIRGTHVFAACNLASERANDNVNACLESKRSECWENGGTWWSSGDPGVRESTETTESDWPACTVDRRHYWKCEGRTDAQAGLQSAESSQGSSAQSTTPNVGTCTDSQDTTSDTLPLNCNLPMVGAIGTVNKCLAEEEAKCKQRGGTFTSPNQAEAPASQISELRAFPLCTVKAEAQWECVGGQ